jgi:hypothetical protein
MFPIMSLSPVVRVARYRRRRLWTRFALAGTLVACTKDAPPPQTPAVITDTVPKIVAVDTQPTAVVTRWDASAGAALYVPGDNGVAQVVLPPVVDDSVPKPGVAVLPPGSAPASVDLFAPGAKVGAATLGEFVRASQPEVSEGCDAWPIVSLREAADGSSKNWRIALGSGVAQAVALDSIGALPRRDSAQLVVAINRAAAQLTLDSAGVLRGVPFSVGKAYRLILAGEVEVVMTVVERRLNVEASPRVERTVLILERVRGAKGFTATWRDTQYATEDDLIATDLLTVVRLKGSPLLTMFLGQDFGDGSRVEMLQRAPSGGWTLRWASAYTGC